MVDEGFLLRMAMFNRDTQDKYKRDKILHEDDKNKESPPKI
jgi:hypothetical protein